MNIFSNPDGSPRQATDAERAVWNTAIDYFNGLELPDVLVQPSEGQSKQVIVINFDGTGNNVLTNPAEDSNIGELWSGLRGLDTSDANLDSHYIAGIGTTGIGQTAQQMFALGATARLREAMQVVSSIVSDNPGKEPYIVVTGFSRGAALARAFMNLINDYGIPALDDPSTTLAYDTSTAQREPGSVHMSAILYDTVATGMSFDYAIPPTVDSLVHFTAAGEMRESFKLTSALAGPGSATNRLIEVQLPGVHSDIGGGYPLDGVANFALYFARDILRDWGLTGVQGDEPDTSDQKNWWVHDSRALATKVWRVLDSWNGRETVYVAPDDASPFAARLAQLYQGIAGSWTGSPDVPPEIQSPPNSQPITFNVPSIDFNEFSYEQFVDLLFDSYESSADSWSYGNEDEWIFGTRNEDVLLASEAMLSAETVFDSIWDGDAFYEDSETHDILFNSNLDYQTAEGLLFDALQESEGNGFNVVALFARMAYAFDMTDDEGYESLVAAVGGEEADLLNLFAFFGGQAGATEVLLADPGDGSVLDGRESAGAVYAYGFDGNDDLYGIISGTRLVGGAGDDTYHVYGSGVSVEEEADGGVDTIYLESGMPGLVSYSLASAIENAVVSDELGAVSLIGNASDNHLVGNGSANTLSGGGGADVLEGKGGDDLYYILDGDATVVEAAGDGIDTVVIRRAEYSMTENVENLLVSGSNDVAAVVAHGNAVGNAMTVLDDSATVEFHGGAGNDVLSGGAGNDVLFGEGDNDSLAGNAGDDYLDGGTGTDHLWGGEGADTLVTRGGVYSVLEGGAGDDFVVESGAGNQANQLFGNEGSDYIRLRGTGSYARGGDGDDSLVDYFGSGNRLFGDAGYDSFELYGNGAIAYGGAGDDYFYDAGIGNTLDGGSGNDFYYSEDATVQIAFGSGYGNDVLQMAGVNSSVVRLSGIRSDQVTVSVEGTSLVFRTADSSLTVFNYITSGAPSLEFGGFEFDDGLKTNGELLDMAGYDSTPPDTSTIWGTAASEDLWGNGVATRIVGLGGDDQLLGSAGVERYEWSEGDGQDTLMVMPGNDMDTVAFTGDGYGITAHRDGNALTLSASTGGGFTIPGWFTGQNRPNIEAPDGSVWTPTQIDAQFSDGVYDISYSTGVYRVEDAMSMLLSYCPDLSLISLEGSNRTDWNWTPTILASALPSSVYGSTYTDAAGQTYQHWSASIVDRAGSGRLNTHRPEISGLAAA